MRPATAATLAATLLAPALPAAGQEIYASSEGHEYALTCNADGLVLTSLYPVARFTGQGAATQVASAIEVLYLGTACDSWSPVLGGGGWSFANGGFAARFGRHDIGFPRQELWCPPGGPQPAYHACTG